MSRTHKLLATILLAFFVLLGATQAAFALGTRAELFVYPVPDLFVGDEIAFQARLTSEQGQGLYDQPLEVYFDGDFLETVVTDPTGTARVVIDRELEAGRYTIEILYAGYQFEVSDAARVEFEISPVEVVIQTVPTIAGLAFQFDGSEVQTGLDGIARIPVQKPGTYDLELLANPEILGDGSTVFVQWFPQEYSMKTEVDVPGVLWQQVGFEQKYEAEFDFVDLNGDPFPEDRVSEMVLRASSGDVVRIRDFDRNLLDVNRVLARLGGLDSSTVVYRVQEVIVDGSDVVNEGQQRFLYSPLRPIRIELLLYDVVFSARDLFFGVPFGETLQLEFPDGSVESFAFDPGQGLSLPGLARGDYEVRVETNRGFTFALPLVVSRDQEVVVPIISFIDVMLAGGTLLGLLIGLPVWGRRRRILAILLGRDRS